MIKAVAILPCKDEEATIKETILKLRSSCRKSNIFLEVIGIDDYSKDKTRLELNRYADFVISLNRHVPLAEVIRLGLKCALMKKPDLIIHIDADGQYDPMDLEKLIEPILKNRSDFVIGNRDVIRLRHMPFHKKAGNIFFSHLVSSIIRRKLNDTQSGFRVIRSSAAKKIKILSYFTYTQEEIIKASRLGFRISEVPINFKKRKNGKSRLINNPVAYGIRAMLDIFRVIIND